MIDGQWIKARLSGRRGEKKALADALGINPGKLSHMLAGDRKVQPNEIAPLLRFFRGTLGESDQAPLIEIITAALPDLEEGDQRMVADLVRSLARPSAGRFAL